MQSGHLMTNILRAHAAPIKGLKNIKSQIVLREKDQKIFVRYVMKCKKRKGDLGKCLRKFQARKPHIWEITYPDGKTVLVGDDINREIFKELLAEKDSDIPLKSSP